MAVYIPYIVGSSIAAYVTKGLYSYINEPKIVLKSDTNNNSNIEDNTFLKKDNNDNREELLENELDIIESNSVKTSKVEVTDILLDGDKNIPIKYNK